MTDQTTNGGPQETALTADDLTLVDDRLEDIGKDADALWDELDAKDAGKDGDAAPGDDGKDAGETDAFDDEAEADGDAEPDQPDAAKADPAPARGADKPDIWANATPEQRAELDSLRAAKDRAEHDARSQSGRQAALQRRINELTRKAQPGTKREALRPEEAFAGMEEDYPEIAEPLKKALSPIAERMTKDEEERTAAQEAERRAAETELTEIVNEQTDILLKQHPDYDAFLKQNGAAFGAWVEDQPRKIREAAYRNAEYIFDAEGAIEIMNAFKAFIQPKPAAEPAPAQPQSTQPLNDRRQRQLNGSASPRSHAGRPTVSGIPRDGDPDAIWDAFDAEEKRARA